MNNSDVHFYPLTLNQIRKLIRKIAELKRKSNDEQATKTT